MQCICLLLTESGRCPNLIAFENWRRGYLTAEGYVRRRDFVKGVVGSTVVWPLAERAGHAMAVAPLSAVAGKGAPVR